MGGVGESAILTGLDTICPSLIVIVVILKRIPQRKYRYI
jgi:hypothetical protein